MIGLISRFIPGASWLNLAAGAVAGALLVSGPVYLKGRADGAALAELAQLKDTVKAHETRNQVDQDVDALSLVARCLELGGMPERCNELRGLDQTAPRQ